MISEFNATVNAVALLIYFGLLSGVIGCAAPGVATQASRDKLECEYKARYDSYGNPRTTFDTATMLEACDR